MDTGHVSQESGSSFWIKKSMDRQTQVFPVGGMASPPLCGDVDRSKFRVRSYLPLLMSFPRVRAF